MALQDARGLVRVEAALQVPGSDAQGGWHGPCPVLLQFDLVECRDRGDRFGVCLGGWRQGQEATAICRRHRCQAFDDVVPDADDRGGGHPCTDVWTPRCDLLPRAAIPAVALSDVGRLDGFMAGPLFGIDPAEYGW